MIYLVAITHIQITVGELERMTFKNVQDKKAASGQMHYTMVDVDLAAHSESGPKGVYIWLLKAFRSFTSNRECKKES